MYLQDLFVDPAMRGQGLGRALIEHVYAEAAARGCSRVWWLTHETNTDAMVLYDRVADKSGFVQYPEGPVMLAGRVRASIQWGHGSTPYPRRGAS